MTTHTCTPTGKALPFGRKAEPGSCPRCDELRDGAPPRTPTWAENAKRRAAQAAADAAAPRHDCATSRCGLICTSGDW